MPKMLASTRYGVDWNLHSDDHSGWSFTVDSVNAILLQEIRDELKTLNKLLLCENFLRIPRTLLEIRNASRTKATPRRRSKRR